MAVKRDDFILKKVLFVNSISPFKKPKIIVISDLLIFQKAKKRFHDLKIKGKSKRNQREIKEKSKKLRSDSLNVTLSLFKIMNVPLWFF
jgi:hypothetical protein